MSEAEPPKKYVEVLGRGMSQSKWGRAASSRSSTLRNGLLRQQTANP